MLGSLFVSPQKRLSLLEDDDDEDALALCRLFALNGPAERRLWSLSLMGDGGETKDHEGDDDDVEDEGDGWLGFIEVFPSRDFFVSATGNRVFLLWLSRGATRKLSFV